MDDDRDEASEEPTSPLAEQNTTPGPEPTPPTVQQPHEPPGGPSQPYPGYWYGPPTGPWPFPPGYGPGYGMPPWQGVPPYGAPPPPPYATAPPGAPAPSRPPRGRVRALVGTAAVAWIVAGLLALTVAGLAAALATTNSGSGPVAFRTPFGFGPNAPGQLGPGVRGPGYFGRLGNPAVVGSVASVGTNSFTVSSRAGETVTVQEQSSTVYYSGPTKSSSSAVVQGAIVAVQGTRSDNTVTATSVVVLGAGRFVPGPGNS